MASQSVLVGAGVMTLIDRSVSPVIAVPVIALTDISIDFSWENRELAADYQFPIAVARVGAKVKLKAKSADVNATALAKLLGATQVAGTTKVVTETPVASASVIVSNSATWVDDLGVRNPSGKLMSRVASGPIVDVSYSVAAGTYTFAAGQTTGTLSIRYSYTVAGSGTTSSVSNQQDAATPMFEAVLFNTWTQQDGSVGTAGFRFYAVTAEKLAMAAKRDDFTVFDIDLSAYPRVSDNKVYDTFNS
jgi:hypothetical protein